MSAGEALFIEPWTVTAPQSRCDSHDHLTILLIVGGFYEALPKAYASPAAGFV